MDIKKIIGIISGVAVAVALAAFFIAQNPAWVNRAMDWLFKTLGM